MCVSWPFSLVRLRAHHVRSRRLGENGTGRVPKSPVMRTDTGTTGGDSVKAVREYLSYVMKDGLGPVTFVMERRTSR